MTAVPHLSLRRRRRALTALLTLIAVVMSGALLAPAADAHPSHLKPSHVRPNRFDPYGASIADIHRALARGRTTPSAVVDAYLDRIEAFESRGPAINALIAVNPKARDTARAQDRILRRDPRRLADLPLLGVPVIVKDNIDVAGLPTTGGSLALRRNVANRDATVVRRLEAQGAIVLAKANLSELAASYGRLGYSAVGGLTLNPYDLARNASGSSSGSAAAVAAQFAPIAIGTDTSGSIRGPASVTGLVGVRPTLGLTSRTGVIPYSLNLDVTGPLARSVTDAAETLTAMSGRDQADPATSTGPARRADYAAGLRGATLRGQRVGVIDAFNGSNPDVAATYATTVATLRARGATVVPVRLSANAQYLWTPVVGPLGELDFVHDVESYLAGTRRGVPKTTQQVIDISESPLAQSWPTPPNPARIQGLRDAVAAAPGRGGADYDQILTVERPKAQAEITTLLTTNRLSALVYPTIECPASARFDVPDPTYTCTSADEYAPSYISPATGYPEVTVPAGVDPQGLPIGMSFLGAPYSEQQLLRLARAFERANDLDLTPPTTPAEPPRSR